MRNNTLLNVGTKLFHQGDMANPSSEGTILEVIRDPKWGTKYKVKFDERETVSTIEAYMVKTCTVAGLGNGHFRIVTLDSYQAARSEAIAAFKKQYA